MLAMPNDDLVQFNIRISKADFEFYDSECKRLGFSKPDLFHRLMDRVRGTQHLSPEDRNAMGDILAVATPDTGECDHAWDDGRRGASGLSVLECLNCGARKFDGDPAPSRYSPRRSQPGAEAIRKFNDPNGG